MEKSFREISFCSQVWSLIFHTHNKPISLGLLIKCNLSHKNMPFFSGYSSRGSFWLHLQGDSGRRELPFCLLCFSVCQWITGKTSRTSWGSINYLARQTIMIRFSSLLKFLRPAIERLCTEGFWVFFAGRWDHADLKASIFQGSRVEKIKSPVAAVWCLPFDAIPQTLWKNWRWETVSALCYASFEKSQIGSCFAIKCSHFLSNKKETLIIPAVTATCLNLLLSSRGQYCPLTDSVCHARSFAWQY